MEGGRGGEHPPSLTLSLPTSPWQWLENVSLDGGEKKAKAIFTVGFAASSGGLVGGAIGEVVGVGPVGVEVRRLVGSSSRTFKSQTWDAAEKAVKVASSFPPALVLSLGLLLLYQGKAPSNTLHFSLSFCTRVFTLVFVELLVSQKFFYKPQKNVFFFFSFFPQIFSTVLRWSKRSIKQRRVTPISVVEFSIFIIYFN